MHARPSPSHRVTLQLQRYGAQNRAALTESEARLWSALRAGQLGVSFRRQVPLGGQFIVDFLAPRARLVVDGTYHARRRGADGRRDAKLRRLGYGVLRLPAVLVMKDLTVAVELVRAAL